MTAPPYGGQLPLFPGVEGRVAEPVRRMLVPPLAPTSSLAAAIGAFDEHLAREGKTENTRQAFASDLRLLAHYHGADRSLEQFATDDLNRFLTWMLLQRARPCSAKTYARRVTTLKVFFAWLTECTVLPADPAAPLVHRQAEPPLPLVLTDEETLRLLAAAARRDPAASGDPRAALVIRLLLDTALKKGELVRLRTDDLATAAEPPSLLVRYDQPRWREKERRVSFSPWLAPVLDGYRERYQPGERLFTCTARNLEYILAELVATAGLPERTGFETLRWTSALRAYRAGLAPDTLRQRLGLSPITWAETERKLGLLAAGVGPSGAGIGLFFPPPAELAG